MKKLLLVISGIAMVFIFLLAPTLVLGQFGNTPPGYQFDNTPQTSFTGQYSVQIQNPLKATTISQFIEEVLKAVILIGIPVAVLFIVFAGFKFVLALGRPDKLTEAKKNLSYTLLGIAIFLGAWIIAQVIHNTVMRLGAGTGLPPGFQ